MKKRFTDAQIVGFLREAFTLSGWIYRKCRAAKARPEPDFRYRSKADARAMRSNAIETTTCHGQPDAVCGARTRSIARWPVQA